MFKTDMQKMSVEEHRKSLRDDAGFHVGPIQVGPNGHPGFEVTHPKQHWREFDERGSMVVTRPAATAPPARTAPRLKKGDSVYHPRGGMGIVISSDGHAVRALWEKGPSEHESVMLSEVSHLKRGATVQKPTQTGPRGGRYTITAAGTKHYGDPKLDPGK